MIANAFSLALQAIRRNALRSFLTVLGIVIGVSAVIIMVTIGKGTTAKVTADIAALGSNMLIVHPGQSRHGGRSAEAKPLEVADVEAIAREVPHLAAVAPVAMKSSPIVFGNDNYNTQAAGVDNDYFKARNWDMALGRTFLPSELRAGTAVCILGNTVVNELFGGMNPLGQRVRLGEISFEVVGTLVAKGQSGMGSDQDDVALVPLRTMQRRIIGNTDIPLVFVSVSDGYSTEDSVAEIEELLRQRRRITGNKEDDFSVMDMKEITETLTGTTKVLTGLLGAVAAVSLLVGGIGIMNIMLVSVTERTREIGTRLAIGAMERDVLTQFLVEAVVLSSLGGVIGIVLAVVTSAWLAGLFKIPLVLDPGIVALAFLFSAAVGVVFGFFPARRAARMDPVEALRRE
ncbi:MAG: ABC transporter permease [Proteobacteria bacterium]|nr:ABC transporter permease [Pseudomonadota bacterium]